MYTRLLAMTNEFSFAKKPRLIPSLTEPTDDPATEPYPDKESSGVAATMAPAEPARAVTRPDDATALGAGQDSVPDPRIRIYHGQYIDCHDQRRDTWDAVIEANWQDEGTPVFYRRDGVMVTIPDADDGSPTIQRVSPHLMENYLADIISCKSPLAASRDGGIRPARNYDFFIPGWLGSGSRHNPGKNARRIAVTEDSLGVQVWRLTCLSKRCTLAGTRSDPGRHRRQAGG